MPWKVEYLIQCFKEGCGEGGGFEADSIGVRNGATDEADVAIPAQFPVDDGCLHFAILFMQDVETHLSQFLFSKSRFRDYYSDGHPTQETGLKHL